jgi:predicted N-formylglutamate amidohydrolase
VRAEPLIMGFHLLAEDEPPPVLASRREGRSAFVIAVDHASRRIPKRLAMLGLGESDLERHIAWDIGALAVAQRVSAALDAPLVAQNYSRLVIDCNRGPGRPTSIPTISESTPIPGNIDLTAEEVGARQRDIFEPYHRHLSGLLDERAAAGRRTILIVQHSMTNVFKGVRREMHAAVLYNHDPRFARCLLEALRSEAGLMVGDNEPYSGKEQVGYTLPHHGESRGLPHVEIEIRQDLVETPSGQAEWSRRITAALLAADQAFLRRFS